MNKNVIRALLAASVLTVGAAQAASSVQIPLQGVLPKACSVTAQNDSFSTLNMTSTAAQGGEQISASCNYIGTLRVDVSSANNGRLVTQDNNGAHVAYTVTVPGYASGVSLSSPLSLPNWNTTLNAQTGTFSVRLANAATVAGTYNDTITIQVTPN